MRKLNSMFHIDGERLVKTSNNEPVPASEPVIVLRGRDHLTLPAMRHYRELAVADGCNEWFLERLDASIKDLERFIALYPERMKQPGITRGK